jgi:hypothetical protein
MAFKHHYHEVLDTIGDMFTQIFRGLRDRYQVGRVFSIHENCLADPGSLPGSRIQGSKRHWIPDPDPQHCDEVRLPKNYYRQYFFEYGYFSPLLSQFCVSETVCKIAS